MNTAALLVELYGRIPPLGRDAAEGLNVDTLTAAPASGANTIAWLVWHAARVQDHHMAEILHEPQLWASDDTWARRCGLDPNPRNTGYGHTPDDVAAVRPDGPDVLIAYLNAVTARTQSFLERIKDNDLDEVVDRRWDPPVTLGVRLVSIADDSLQHLGQAAYVRGLLR